MQAVYLLNTVMKWDSSKDNTLSLIVNLVQNNPRKGLNRPKLEVLLVNLKRIVDQKKSLQNQANVRNVYQLKDHHLIKRDALSINYAQKLRGLILMESVSSAHPLTCKTH